MTEKEHLAAASVWVVSLLAVAASWVVVAHTDRVAASAREVSVPGVRAAPVAGLVPVASARRRVVVVRRSRAS